MIAFPPITASSSTLADILEELHDEVYVYDALSLRMVYANKTARLRCGWDGAALGTKRIYDSSDMFDTPGFHRHVEPLRQGLTDAVTIEALHEKGLVEITTRLLPAWNGVPVFISVLRDREHRRQLERARSQAFSEIVHDLRTPLTSIMGALKLMESGALGDLPPQAQNLLGLVQRNADTLLSIVGDILDLQKFATNGRDSLEDMEHLDLVALTKEAVSAHLGYCAVHNVSVRMTAAPDLAWVNGVPLRLHQMLANLLSNAIKNSRPTKPSRSNCASKARPGKFASATLARAFPNTCARGFSTITSRLRHRRKRRLKEPAWVWQSVRKLSNPTVVKSTFRAILMDGRCSLWTSRNKSRPAATPNSEQTRLDSRRPA